MLHVHEGEDGGEGPADEVTEGPREQEKAG
jgi:hypothetical protein